MSQELAKAFTENTQHVSLAKDYQVFCSADTKLFDHLKSHGFLCNQFAYPDPNAPAINKAIQLTSIYLEDIHDLVSALALYIP